MIIRALIILSLIFAPAQKLSSPVTISGPVTIPAPAAGGAAPTFVQDTYGGAVGTFVCDGAATCSAIAITTTTGDGLSVATFALSGSGTLASGTTITSVADTCGTSGSASNSYSLAAAIAGNQVKQFYTIVGFGKSCVVTVTANNASNILLLYVKQIHGVNATSPVGVNQWAVNSQGSPAASADAVTTGALGAGTTQANALLDCTSVKILSSSNTWTVGTGQTLASVRTDSLNSVIGSTETLATSGVTTPCTATASDGPANNFVSIGMVWQHP
jgi:hypothetical protein